MSGKPAPKKKVKPGYRLPIRNSGDMLLLAEWYADRGDTVREAHCRQAFAMMEVTARTARQTFDAMMSLARVAGRLLHTVQTAMESAPTEPEFPMQFDHQRRLDAQIRRLTRE